MAGGSDECTTNVSRNVNKEDEYGHRDWCVVAWHCLAATFMDLLYCNGRENIEKEKLSDGARQIIEELVAKELMEESDVSLEPLKPWQRYHVFSGRFIENVHWSITGKCNFNCRHCLVSAPGNHHPQLALTDCLKIVDEMAKCGVKEVDIPRQQLLFQLQVRPSLRPSQMIQ